MKEPSSVILTVVVLMLCFLAWRIYMIETALQPLINTINLLNNFLP